MTRFEMKKVMMNCAAATFIFLASPQSKHWLFRAMIRALA